MMGLEPTTFCMAMGSGDLTTHDMTYGIRTVQRNCSLSRGASWGPRRVSKAGQEADHA
jgi:hypothetical protein